MTAGTEAAGALAYHGGNAAAAQRLFPSAPLPWIDLSTGLNPHPYPDVSLPADAWTRLPEPDAILALEAAAAAAYGAARPADVVAAPGTQALLQWLPRLLRGRRVGILGPTYGEHERTWSAAGAEVVTVRELSALTPFDVAVVVNPNNPDGRLTPVEDLLALTGELARRGGTLVIDEAFMDVVRPSASVVPHLPAGNAVVLRSFGKAYGLGGLRLGFAVASGGIAPALRRALGPWAVSGPATVIGCRALADRGWLDAVLERLWRDGQRLDALLAGAGFTNIGGTRLFRLVARPRAAAWFERLGEAGILVRPFADNAGWLRFGMPGEPAWRRLEAALLGVPRSRTNAAPERSR